MNRWDNAAIEYTDAAKIKSALVGRSIVTTISEGQDTDRVLSFVLDDGTVLKAHATDGGCACSNGCFTVAPVNVIKGTITNVEVREFRQTWDGAEGEQIEPGSDRDGSAVIRVFVYADLGEQVLVESEGSDNGYYVHRSRHRGARKGLRDSTTRRRALQRRWQLGSHREVRRLRGGRRRRG